MMIFRNPRIRWTKIAISFLAATCLLSTRRAGAIDPIKEIKNPERLTELPQTLYQEKYRPQFHFTARQWTVNHLNPGQREEGWINDLNGLIFYDGEYHLFAQRWAKCWLHAVSTDLVHWTELQPAFWEESDGSGVQSGTCVIDYENTSGLAKDKSKPAMVAFWSRFDNHSQCISYSLDHGRTWTKYEKNPIFDHPERDPKVFWYAPGKHWVMMMYGKDHYHILTSSNLLEWKDEQHPIANCFECPDFFEMEVDGKADAKKWVMIQGSGKYSIGAFDGHEFKEETDRLSCDVGQNFYATQSFENTETGDGRHIQLAWMRGGVYPDMPFNQQISFPCELSLRATSEGLRLFRMPVKEIGLLHGKAIDLKDQTLKDGATLVLAPSGESFHIKAEVNIPADGKLIFDVLGTSVTLTTKGLRSGNGHGTLIDPIKTVELLIDRTSIEVFVNGGEISLSRCMLPKTEGVSVRAEGGAVAMPAITVYPMKSAWATSGLK